ncbi:caspase family protein [Thioalkalicoccus limnaeus]|uniref:Caspase family protein n=1 Tax=Thioalkalicoccus limnaeus TaxID=120681 RepID=A0ABV4BC90_9GAMM
MLLFCLGQAAAEEEPPWRVFETGGHTGKIRDLAFTSDGKLLVSGGYDKTVRIWDTKTGETTRVLRGEIGDGLSGAIYALALSPDDAILAVGGNLPGHEPGQHPIRLHDVRDGVVTHLLVGHEDVVLGLDFSPTGTHLVSAGADGQAIVWDTRGFSLRHRLTGHDGPVPAVAVSPDGVRVASADTEGLVRVWDLASGALTHQFEGHDGAVLSLAFSPDGRLLASGGEDERVRFWETDDWTAVLGEDGREPIIGRQESDVTSIAFSPDGRLVLTGAGYGAGAYSSVFEVATGKLVYQTGYDNLVLAVAISPDGHTAAIAGGDRDEIFLRDLGSGNLKAKLSGLARMVWAVGFARNGDSIAYGQEFDIDSPDHYLGPLQRAISFRSNGEYHIELGETLRADDADTYLRARSRHGSYELRTRDGPFGYQGVMQVYRDGILMYEIERDQTSGFRHRSYSLTQDGEHFISGGSNGTLAMFETATGNKLRDLVGHSGDVYDVAVAPDDSTLVTGSADGTIRLWDLATGRELVTIFVAADDQWAAWTTTGYYASSPIGDRYIGWHINRGPARAADFFRAQQFQQELYRPDVVGNMLEMRDIEAALGQANRRRGGTLAERTDGPLESVAAIVPPFLHVEPFRRDRFRVEDETLPVRIVAKSYHWPITEIRVELNGGLVLAQPFATADAHEPLDGDGLDEQVLELDLDLEEGQNTLKVVALNGKGISEPEVRQVVLEPRTPIEEIKPNLVLLAIGVARYPADALRLEFAAKDAETIAELFASQVGGLFGEVHAKVVLDADATRDGIIRAINWLERTGTQNDVRMLFISGHGVLDHRGDYYFLPVDHSPEDEVNVRGVGAAHLYEPLVHIPGKKLLMVDTCRAGAISGTRYKGALVDKTRLVKELNATNSGLVTFTASTSRQLSVEKAEWGLGAFTEAVRSGLSGKADGYGGPKDGVIYVHELGSWIIEQVRQLTEGRQHAIFDSPADSPSFPLFVLH